MKKLKKVLAPITLMLFSLTIISCHENDSPEIDRDNPATKNDVQAMSRMSEENLTSALSEDVDFKALSNMIVFFEEMPNKENFVADFSKEVLESQDDDHYFISLSGYNQQDVTNAKTKINNHTEQILFKFPQLKEYSQTDLYNIVESASNLSNDSVYLNSKVKCSTCAKIGRTKMAFYTLTGAATCGSVGGTLGGPLGALYGGWACGSLGFALAGYEALACLEDCQK